MTFPLVIPNRGRWVTVFSHTAWDFDATGQTDASFRQIVPAISVGGSKIRVTFRGNSSATSAFDNMAVGIRSGSTDDCTGVPTELKISGASGASISADGTALTDETAFTTTAGQDLLVVIDTASANGNMRWRTTDPGGGVNAYRQLAAATYNNANMTGTLNGGGCYVASVQKVEIWTG